MRLFQIGLLILAISLLVFVFSLLLSKRSGLPEGRLVYADNEALQRLPKPLYDAELRLVGKPDYVMKLKDQSIVPVEFKSQNAPSYPYDSHILQLSAYCYLCEKAFGRKPAYGLIRYADKTFKITYDERLQERLTQTIHEIRRCEAYSEAPVRSHSQPSRCHACGYRSTCGQSL